MVDLLVPQSTPERIDVITLVVTRDVMISNGERQPLRALYPAAACTQGGHRCHYGMKTAC